MNTPEKSIPEMIPLLDQKQFELLLGKIPTEEPVPSFAVVYFTAEWCKPCKRLNLQEIQETLPMATWYKCDYVLNEYTAGYCGIRNFPTFMVIRDTKILGQFKDSSTEKIVDWLKRFAE